MLVSVTKNGDASWLLAYERVTPIYSNTAEMSCQMCSVVNLYGSASSWSVLHKVVSS